MAGVPGPLLLVLLLTAAPHVGGQATRGVLGGGRCYSDKDAFSDLPSNPVAPTKCIMKCVNDGFTHMGLSNNGPTCYCGNITTPSVIETDNCAVCSSNVNFTCGTDPSVYVYVLRACSMGSFGIMCDRKCYCDSQAACNLTGSCPGNCAAGYTGSPCTEIVTSPTAAPSTTSSVSACPDGYDCNATCHCANVTSCPVCDVMGCQAGYQHSSSNVTDCQQGCIGETFGSGCTETCSPNCMTCNPVTGCTECVSGAGSTPDCVPPVTQPTEAATGVPSPSEGNNNKDTNTDDNNSELDPWVIYVMGGVAGVLVLVLITLICVFVSRRRRQRRLKEKLDEQTGPPVEQAGFDGAAQEGLQPSKDSLTIPAAPRPDSQVSGPVSDDYDLMAPEPPHDFALPVAGLEAHIKKVRQMEAMPFKEEYEKIPEGQTAPWDFGMKKNIHRDKNRFGNIVSYDHSRVPLIRKKDDASEYINANFVDGYKQAKAFIATQGPMPQTVNDFWRMCWEQEVPIIVMVTNCIENGRQKSEQYWPDNHQNKTVGDLIVYTEEEQIFSDFTIRSLHLKKGDDVRKIKHFQFTGWPDHGVPRQATPLLTLRRRVRAEMATKAGVTGPAVVHCSAGVGRSGTFMAVDYLKNQAEAEDRIDVFGCVWRMRYQRVNMVQTWDQYNFIYDALLEAVTVGQTTIACYQFSEIYPTWLEPDPDSKINKLQQQLRILDVVKQNFPDTEFETALKSANKAKNRKEDIIPANYYRPYLQTRVDGTTDYINAVFVQGYYKREAFLITQAPLPDTRVDFWRMVYDYDCTSVISLQDYKRTDSSFLPCWPEEGGSMTLGPFIVNNSKMTTDPATGVTIIELSLKLGKKDKDVRQVNVFSVAEFPPSDVAPLPAKQQISLKEAVKKWQQQKGDQTVVVMCKYGVDRCGLYCALDYVIDMMDVEQDVDVFQAVRQVQMSRPQLVPNIEQFQFLYEAAQIYMDINMAYANFQ